MEAHLAQLEDIRFVVETYSTFEWEDVRARDRQTLIVELGERIVRLRNFTMTQLTERLINLERQGKFSRHLLIHPNIYINSIFFLPFLIYTFCYHGRCNFLQLPPLQVFQLLLFLPRRDLVV